MRQLAVRLFLVAISMAWTSIASADDQTRLAAYQSLGVPQNEQPVTFHLRPTTKGDRVDQQYTVSLELESTVRRANGEIEKSSNTIGREQQRTLVVDEVVDGRSVGARVRFAKYVRTADGESAEAPIVGKTYRCRRMEDDRLSVVATDGTFVSPDEFTLVCEGMHTLGKPNPLADYLAGKTVQVGQTLEVPLEIGDSLLSSDGALGRVSKFVLTLRELSPETHLASFDIELESQGAETTQMRMMVHGTLDVEPQTCRARRMEFHGPLGMATTIGSHSAAETTFVRGKLKMEMTATYVDP